MPHLRPGALVVVALSLFLLSAGPAGAASVRITAMATPPDPTATFSYGVGGRDCGPDGGAFPFSLHHGESRTITKNCPPDPDDVERTTLTVSSNGPPGTPVGGGTSYVFEGWTCTGAAVTNGGTTVEVIRTGSADCVASYRRPPPACSDGQDNDADGQTDFPADTGCADGSDPLEQDCTITGTPGNDVLNGTAGSDIICGEGGDDQISGNGGEDEVRGGDGDDELYGNQGRDLVVGGPGNDEMDGKVGADLVSGGPGHDTVVGGEGDDILLGDEGRDLLSDGQGRNSFVSGAGDDIVSSRRKEVAERVDCGAGNDHAVLDRKDSVSSCETAERPPEGVKRLGGGKAAIAVAAAMDWPRTLTEWEPHGKSTTRFYAWLDPAGSNRALTCDPESRAVRPAITAAFWRLKGLRIRWISIAFRSAAIEPLKGDLTSQMAAAKANSLSTDRTTEESFWHARAPRMGIGTGLRSALSQVFVQYRVKWSSERPGRDKHWRTKWITLGSCNFKRSVAVSPTR